MVLPHNHNHTIILNIFLLGTKPFSILISISIFSFLLFSHRNKITLFDNFRNRNLQLNQNNDSSNNNEYREIEYQERQSHFRNMIYETYNGTWSCASSLSHFSTSNGTVQFQSKIFRRFKGSKGLYFNYEFFLFEREYNSHYFLITNSAFFSLINNLPEMFIDKLNQTLFINNSLLFSINEMRFFSKIDNQFSQGKINLKYPNEQSQNKAIKGSIEFNNILITLDLTMNNDSFFNDLSQIFACLFLLSIFQILANYNLFKELELKETESLKYSPHNVLFNCIYNGSLWFECFIASLFDEKLFKYFAVPALIYMINCFFIEPKLFFHIAKIHIESNYDDLILRVNVMKRETLKFYLYYLIILSLFIYSPDLFFSKPFHYFFVGITFIFQIGYNFKSYNRQMININYIAIVSVNRIFHPLFFRAKPNFLYFETDYIFSTIIVFLITIQIVALVIQKYYRNNYLHAKIFRTNQYNYFKSLKDILKIKKDLLPSHCPICSLGFIRDKNGNNTTVIITQPNAIVIPSNDNQNPKEDLNLNTVPFDKENYQNKDKEKVQLTTQEDSINKAKENKRRRCCMCSCCKCLCCKKKRLNLNEIVMLTPCNHVYHIDCLQNWIKIKTNCPVCRADLPKVV